MPPVSDIFNRSRAKRIKEEEEIERQKEALNRQLDQHKKDIRLQREKTLNELTAIYENAKEQVVIWHQGEVAAADRSYNQEQAEFTVVLNEVAYFREHETRNINEQFNINRDQLLQNKQAEEKSIAECFVQVTKISSVIKEYHETATCKLEKLQIQTANETLGENFRLAYQNLKQPNYNNLNKTKNYTLLVGYVKQLTEQHVISDHDFQHYAGFFSALLDGKITANDSFTKADLEVSKLLQDLDSYDAKMVLEAYQEDRQSQTKLYRQATEFSQLLQEKVVISQKDIDAVYNKRSLDLIAEHILQQAQLENSYQELLQQIATSKDNSQTQFDAYVASLNDSKVLQLITLESQALQEKNKVDFQCQLALQQIDQVLRTELDQINAIRDVRIKSLKKASKYKLINSITTIVSGALAIFSGGALTGVSAALVEAVQTSLAAISLGSLERFVNNKPKFGVEFTGRLAFTQPDDYHGGKMKSQTKIHSPTLERSTNLQVVRERLKQFKQGVKIKQTTAENKLFYQLYKEVLPNNIYLSYLGKTPVSGWRSIACGTVSNNQFNMYGKNVAIDLELRKSCYFDISNDWDNARWLSFNGVSNKAIAFKVSSPKLRVENQLQATNQSSSNTTSLLQSDELAAAHRQANNIRWLKKLEMFSGGLDHFTSQNQANSSWGNNDFDLESTLYNSQSKGILNLYKRHQVGIRGMGAMQAAYGTSQIGLSVALAGTAIGAIPAYALGIKGADNVTAGAIAFVTGKDTSTVFNQAIKGLGLSDTAAAWVEFGVDLSPVASVMIRNAGSIIKGGVLKLYDLRMARQPVISASSLAEIAWGTGKLSSRQTTLLDNLPNVGSELRLHKSGINTTDLAALTAYSGDEFAIFTRGSQRLVIHGDSTNMGLSVKKLKSFKDQGFKFSAHTHPTNTTFGRYILDASGGDRLALQIFEQERSLILDSLGRRNIFDQTDNLSADILQSLRQAINYLPRGPRP